MKKLILILMIFISTIGYSSHNGYFEVEYIKESAMLPMMTNEGGWVETKNSPEIMVKRVSHGSGKYEYSMHPSEGGTLYFNDGNRSISIKRLKLISRNGNGWKKYLTFSGMLHVQKDSTLGGHYTSDPITLYIIDEKGGPWERINVYFDIYIEKTLSLKVTNMSLGKGIRGERLSSDKGDGRPGILYIEGTPNEEVEISYPKVVYLDRVGGGDSKMKVHITNSTHQNNGEIELDLDYYGTAEVKFNGTTENTSKLQGGQYRGQMQIDVRYD
nr:hypothetical protein [uncultured Cetobacterium sp.]